MKKLLFLIVVLLMSSCASHQCHTVGDTPHSRKSMKTAQARVNHFNPH